MKDVNLSEYRAKKEGRTTVSSLLKNTLERAEEFDHVIVVVLDKDGYVNVGHSEMDSSLKLLGLIEAGKSQIIDAFKS